MVTDSICLLFQEYPTVTLTEGVDLTQLRWSYYSNNSLTDREIIFFELDDEPSAINLSSTFLFVELRNISHTHNVFGNFSSLLTLNLSQFETQHAQYVPI